MSRFLDADRRQPADGKCLTEILNLALSRSMDDDASTLPPDASIRLLAESDLPTMASIYKTVFPTYPFPVHDVGYLAETMCGNVDYYGVEVDGELVALSSSEMDLEAGNSEMTDFATLPSWRGRGFAVHLLKRMEKDAPARGIKTAYTIARALSPGMNITFAKRHYCFGGMLVNNTNISGKIESMNIWHKPLPSDNP